MKKIILFATIISCALMGSAQIDSTSKNFAKYQILPSFKLNTVPDSSEFSNKNLNHAKPVVIMFFSPDCEHCQKETKELLAYKSDLKNIQIVMLSPSSYPTLKKFYEEYGIPAIPSIKMGQDVNYTLGSLYQIRTFPTLYVYSKTGKLLKAFAGNVGVPEILEAVK